MRKFCIAVCIIFFALSTLNLSAEPFTKENIIIGFGDLLTLSSYSGDLHDDMESSLGINGDSSLFAQYFLIDGLSLGGYITYQNTNYDATNPGDTETETTWAIGPMISYYLPLKDKLLANINVYYTIGKYKSEIKGFGSSTSDFSSYGFSGELNYMITNFLAIAGGIDYSFDHVENKDLNIDDDGNTLSLTAGFKVFFK